MLVLLTDMVRSQNRDSGESDALANSERDDRYRVVRETLEVRENQNRPHQWNFQRPYPSRDSSSRHYQPPVKWTSYLERKKKDRRCYTCRQLGHATKVCPQSQEL